MTPRRGADAAAAKSPRQSRRAHAIATPRVALIAAVAAQRRHRRRQPASVAPRRRPEALSRADDRPRGDHGTQDVGIAAARAARAAEHRRHAPARTTPRPAPKSRSRSTTRSRCVRLPEPAFCIGGGELLSRRAAARDDALPDRDRRAISTATRTFPPFDRGDWREIARETHAADAPDGFDYAFVTYERASTDA